MECPVCRTANASELKYCVRCGRKLENSKEANYEQVDMSCYHTEEEYLQKKNKSEISGSTSYISSEFFTSDGLGETDFGERDNALISKPYTDKLSAEKQSVSIDDIKSEYINNENEIDLGGRDEPLISKPYTDSFSVKTQSVCATDMQSDYINNSENEIDLGGRDEPLVFKPYTDSFSVKTQSARATDMQSNYINNSANEIDLSLHNESPVSEPVPLRQNTVNSSPLPSQPYMNANPYFNQIYGIPTVNEALPQIIGYDPNGMPIYSQPAVTYAPPQVIGYDPNGMPIYAHTPVK